MKFICLDFDNCGYHKYLDDEDYLQVDFNNKFHSCPECDYLMSIVEDDFTIESNNKTSSIATNLILKQLNKRFK
jgi:hypothetical protein